VIQDPAAGGSVPGAADVQHAMHELATLTWVDHTALAVLLVFFVIGLFKGLIWQVSRIGILAAAYVVSCRFGNDLAALFARTPAVGGDASAPAPTETTLYLAYVLLFLAVLVALSLLAIVLQRLADKAGLTFFNRLGGGLVGVGTGGAVVLFALFVVHMFFGGSPLAEAAERSYARRLSRQAIDLLGPRVPDELRAVFDLPALRTPSILPDDPMSGSDGGNGLQPLPAQGPR
jgi:uncharacterized membrane protein required for colicin V production